MTRLKAGRRVAIIGITVALTVAACGSDSDTIGVSPIFDGCQAGADSVMAFLQRTLNELGDAEPSELQPFEERFNFGVTGLLLRAQEVHCTEAAFNQAVVARVGELEAAGRGGQLLIEEAGRVGLGSLEESRGGPLTLPGN